MEAKLPESVRRIGITVEKSAPSFLMAFAFYDKTGKLTGHDLGDFLINNIKEPIGLFGRCLQKWIIMLDMILVF